MIINTNYRLGSYVDLCHPCPCQPCQPFPCGNWKSSGPCASPFCPFSTSPPCYQPSFQFPCNNFCPCMPYQPNCCENNCSGFGLSNKNAMFFLAGYLISKNKKYC